MALPGRALSARPRARVSWAELCLCCARGPQGPPLSGSQPGLPTLVPPTAPTTLSDPVSLSALRRATAPSRVCAVCVCVCVCVCVRACARSHPCTCGMHTCMHTCSHVRAHAHHTHLHTLAPAPQVCICSLASRGAAEAEEEEGLATEGSSNLVVRPVAAPPWG